MNEITNIKKKTKKEKEMEKKNPRPASSPFLDRKGGLPACCFRLGGCWKRMGRNQSGYVGIGNDD